MTTLNAIVSTVVNLNDSGPGSFRQAIINANSFAGTNVIVFNIPAGLAPLTISALSLMPAINNANVTIDATTQPGYSSTNQPIVQFDGKSLPNGTTGDGLNITASGCTIKGLDISDFPGNGITLSNSTGNVIQGNFIGCDLTGAKTLPNTSNGILIYNSANNLIGGTNALTRNYVVDAGADGIHIEGAAGTNNQVLGNIVGMNSTGTGQPTQVGGNGIIITNAASGNFIGGTNAGAGNVSSGNNKSGLLIAGPNASLNTVQGNFFGIDITGTNAAKNSVDGFTILNSSSNTIGGLTFAARNVIAGNGGNGITISGPAAKYNLVQGNFIGCDQSGTVSLKNNSDGVFATGNSNNVVGGLATGAGNVIADNGSFGVAVNSGQCAILVNSLYGNGNGGDIGLMSGPTQTGNLPAVPPVLTGASNNFTVTWVAGVLTNTPGNIYRLEFYVSPTVSDARTFLGATNVMTVASGTNGVASFQMVFNTGNITNQYITATATDTNGNTSQISVSRVVGFNGLPAILTQPQSVTGFAGNSTNLTVIAAGSPTPNYQWYFQSNLLSGQIGSPLTGQINPTLVFASLTTNNIGNYTVVVGNSYGSMTSSPAIVSIFLPASIAVPPGNLTVTAGQNASFNVVAGGASPLSYQWSFAGTNLVGETNATLTLTNARMAQAGSYTVIVTNSAGSAVSAASLVVDYPIVTLKTVSNAMTAGGFNFQLSMPAGMNYIVLASTDLQVWTPVATNISVTANDLFFDATATNYNRRFYRVMVP